MTSPPLLLLAHTPSADQHAAEIAVHLAALGYEVGALPPTPRLQEKGLKDAHRVVLLWSRDAGKSRSLRAIARRARALGKLACVRLDASKPPRPLCGAAAALPRGRHANHVWRGLLDQAAVTTRAAAEAPSSQRSSRLAGIGTAIVLSLIVSAALYAGDAAFAARVNAMANDAHARAIELVDSIKAQTKRDG